MPRKPIIRSNEHYYHITARSNNKENFYIPRERLWTHFNYLLRELQGKFKLKVGAFVLMDNHFHLLILTPEEDVDKVMYSFMWHLSFHIRKESGRINRIFGSRYKGCVIKDEAHLFNVYKYIYRNPVRAGLCKRIENYPFSSWKRNVVETENLFFSDKWSAGELKWLNEEFEKQQSMGIQRALKKSIFQVNKSWTLPQNKYF